MKAIYVLWIRQLKRYIRSRSRIVASVAQPLLFLVALGFGFGPIYAKAGGGNYIDFLAPGIICMAILFTAIFTGIEIIWDKQFGFLKETLVAPVSRINIMIGRTVGGATVSIVQGVIVFLITLAVGFRPSPDLLLLTLVFMFLVALLFAALGTAIASVIDDMQSFPLIMNFVVMPLFFLSGALFPLTSLSGVLRDIINFNPLAYGVDGVRGTLSPGMGAYPLSLDFTVLLLTTAVIVVIGTYLFTRVEV